MSELEQVLLQHRLIVVYGYMRILGIGFLEALWIEANFTWDYDAEPKRHANCRCVVGVVSV